MSTVKERLQQFLKEENITASEFCRKMGLSSAYLASMRKSMPEEKVEQLTRIYPQLNRDWLLYGEGDMYREDLKEKGIEPYHLHKFMVPLVPAQAAAGTFPLYTSSARPEDCGKVLSPVKDAELAIQIIGDSMEPEIHNGTILVLKRINEKSFIPWATPLVLDTENGSVCKMLFPSDKGEEYVEARSYNPAYPPYQIPLESVYGIYRILGETRGGWTF